MDFLNTFLNVPANRTIVKLVLAVVCAIIAIIAIIALLDYTARLIGVAIISVLVRIIQAEVNHTELKEMLSKR
jgi:hypothetical protein